MADRPPPWTLDQPVTAGRRVVLGQWIGFGRLGALGRDRGAFTAELAAGLPALMLLLLFGLTAVGAVTARGQCVDAAREGALAASRGGSGTESAARIAPAGAQVELTEAVDAVTVTVRAPVPLLGGHLPAITVEATAVAAREPAGPAPTS